MSLAAFDTLAARLTERAEKLARAAAALRRDPVSGWRDARLVWPLFGKE